MIVMTSMIELESLFGPLFDEYFNGENKVVSKSSAITTVDASDKRQQQPDSTSSTSTLATIVTADGNFNVYQDFLTDPSYVDQFVLMNCPYIENTRVNIDDEESINCILVGLVIRSLILGTLHSPELAT
ncbi:retrovirus-related pol polyprotein from transposon TNT 1-94 [Tanacetum coccineum]